MFRVKSAQKVMERLWQTVREKKKGEWTHFGGRENRITSHSPSNNIDIIEHISNQTGFQFSGTDCNI